MRVIAFTGMPGAGKSEALEVAKARGITVVRMGDAVWDEVQRQSLTLNAENVAKVADAMRKANGMDVWAARTVDRIRGLAGSPELVMVDGVRNWEEVVRFRRDLGQSFVLVAVTASPEVRTQRLTSRGRADDSIDEKVVRDRDEREMAWGITRAIALADTTLTNHGSLDDFRNAVATWLDSVTGAT